jgi:hypothetical protein
MQRTIRELAQGREVFGRRALGRSLTPGSALLAVAATVVFTGVVVIVALPVAVMAAILGIMAIFNVILAPIGLAML